MKDTQKYNHGHTRVRYQDSGNQDSNKGARPSDCSVRSDCGRSSARPLGRCHSASVCRVCWFSSNHSGQLAARPESAPTVPLPLTTLLGVVQTLDFYDPLVVVLPTEPCRPGRTRLDTPE